MRLGLRWVLDQNNGLWAGLHATLLLVGLIQHEHVLMYMYIISIFLKIVLPPSHIK